MTRDMLTHSEAKRRLFFLAMSCSLCAIFVAAVFKLTACTEDAVGLIAVFLATLFTFELWGESIGAARFQMQQQKQQKRSTTNSND
jgi:hypothetical protein